jgi:hypothetical protein
MSSSAASSAGSATIGEQPPSTLTVASPSPRVRPLFAIAIAISCAAAHRTDR